MLRNTLSVLSPEESFQSSLSGRSVICCLPESFYISFLRWSLDVANSIFLQSDALLGYVTNFVMVWRNRHESHFSSKCLNAMRRLHKIDVVLDLIEGMGS